MKATVQPDTITNSNKDNIFPALNYIIEIKDNSTHCFFRVDDKLKVFSNRKQADKICQHINNGNITIFNMSEYVFECII